MKPHLVGPLILATLCGCEDQAPNPGPAPAATTSAPTPSTPTAAAAKPASLGAGLIAYVSEREHQKAVFLLDLATGSERRLTARPHDDFIGPPSPRGDRLMVVSSEAQGGLFREQMWHVGRDQRLHRFGPASSMVRNPAWLPDGSAVVVEANHQSFRDLYLVPLAGEPRRLTNQEKGCFEPDVHPDGKRLVYVSSQEGNAEIFTRPLAGGDPQRLTWSPGDDTAPRWSPNGAKIAWLSTRKNKPLAFVMEADGGKPMALDAGAESDDLVQGHDGLTWSPDGTRLAFTQRRRDGSARLRVVKASDGAEVLDSQEASPMPGSIDEMPSWSPDGERLVFASSRWGEEPELALVAAKGGAVTRLTHAEGPDWLPRWLPEPTATWLDASTAHWTESSKDDEKSPASVSSTTAPAASPASSTRVPRVP